MRSVCAVVVTYNRPELLCRCVESLISQDWPLDILIYDNHSSTDTKARLQEVDPLGKSIIYHYADENTGGAGGFHNGMRMAHEAGYDDVLLMDDDGYAVSNDTVSVLMEARDRVGDRAVLNSLVVCDTTTLQLSFSMNRSYDGNSIRRRATNGLFPDWINPFNGTLVSSAVMSEIGYPRKEFFIYGDESEYYWRMMRHGVPMYTVVDSIYYHPTNVGDMRKVFGFNVSVNDVPMWKEYCSSRNTMYYTKLYFGYPALLKTIIRSYVGVILCSSRRWERLVTTTRGMADGLRGDFSRKLDFTK